MGPRSVSQKMSKRVTFCHLLARKITVFIKVPKKVFSSYPGRDSSSSDRRKCRETRRVLKETYKIQLSP
jgi:hypothetical protein